MAHELHNLNEKDRAFMACLLREGSKARDYLQYLPASRQGDLQDFVSQWSSLDTSVQKVELDQCRSEISGSGRVSLLYHAEPAWVGEMLKRECPQVIGIALEKLPRAKLGGILKDFSKETRRELKHVSVSKVLRQVKDLVSKRVEALFPKISLSFLEKDEVLKKLSDLSLVQLFEVLRELGIAEMALAFSKVSRTHTRAILNRLKGADAKELQRRIKKGKKYSVQDQRAAQLHILSLELEKLDPEQIVQEIGFGVLSRAFGPKDRDAATYFIHKFPPSQGYLFKRLVALNQADTLPDKVRRFRERVFDGVTRVQDQS